MTDPPPVSARTLEEHPFLQGLGEDFLLEIAKSTRVAEFATGAKLVQEGEPAEEFYLIIQGKVAVEIVPHDRPRLTVLTVGPGEVFGWSWLVAPYVWGVDARALKLTRALVVSGPALRKSLEAHPRDGYLFLLRLVPVLASRLDATRMQVLDVHHP